MPRAIPRLAALLVVAPFLFSWTPTSASTPPGPAPPELLPDLAQDPPGQISVQQVAGSGGVEFRLGFRSAVRNVGKGPLIIAGDRRSAAAPMRADQVVKLAGGGSRTYPDVIPMRYAYTPTHNHFHVLRFDRYSLRDVRTGARVRPDHKSGFCLGDRKEVSRPRVHPAASYGPLTGECDRGRPQALRVLEGLTSGYLDDYGPQLEGQYINITGLPAGRYSLVHEVNADRRIRERNLTNDVASALVEITWPKGSQQAPAVAVLAKCVNRARCASATARASTAVRPVPVLTEVETASFQLWCSLLDPVGRLTPSAQRARRARIAESRRAWRAAERRASPLGLPSRSGR